MARAARTVTLGSYARAIERAWSAVRGRPTLLSPKEFALVAGWHSRKIPVGLVIETIAEVSRPRRGRGKRAPGSARTLRYFAPAVEEAWAAVRGGRVSASRRGAPPDPPGADPLDFWRRARDDPSSPAALRALLDRLVRDVEAGGDRLRADRCLDRELAEAAPEALLARAAAQAKATLAEAPSSLSAATLRTTQASIIADRLRRALDLPRLGPGDGPETT